MSELELVHRFGDYSPTTLPLHRGARYAIGSSRRCDLRISGSGIARRHAELRVDEYGVHIRLLAGRKEIVFNGEPVRQAGPLAAGDTLSLGDANWQIRQAASDTVCEVAEPTPTPITAASPQAPVTPVAPRISPDLVRRFQEGISQRLDLYRRDILQTLSAQRLREEAAATAWQLIEEGELTLPAEVDAETAVAAVVAETVGLGPIESLMEDPAVSEIMVNGHERIYVERGGRLERTALEFSSAASLDSVLDRIVSPLGRRLDEGSPLVDARLPDGSRVNAIIPPLALNGATLTIRRFGDERIGLDDLIRFGGLDREMADFLRLCVHRRRNILIAGGTGTGKTTVLNALSEEIDESERIVTIEDSAELRLQQDHVVALESRPPNIEGSGAIPIRDLVRNALRMRPDRILVGECRGGEALDMLQAMNTGHDGSLTTAHANTPRDALARLEVMTLMAGMDLPARAIRDQIAAAIDIVVQLTRFGDGARRITAITEVAGMEGDRILLTELFRYDDGFHATGQMPAFIEPTPASVSGFT
ncbi:ATPase, T2SS/T4P/T4SS family [Spiribacter vilamensis]|uniref:Pilus assembly protein CpaF n=1 Tax=Spiribacter vilamensis TaxID=531306 RepID=A0A4V6MHG2_9GAMM|nr:ATPase, T2SS/T4P/T4SS family [Spiribacter vilamensis]RZU98645.1 pilus assembly protein CpaF [Spiribacter vilamensis]TVO60097.1 FHA domain-containing protein [Spiribacter vilamensis]